MINCVLVQNVNNIIFVLIGDMQAALRAAEQKKECAAKRAQPADITSTVTWKPDAKTGHLRPHVAHQRMTIDIEDITEDSQFLEDEPQPYTLPAPFLPTTQLYPDVHTDKLNFVSDPVLQAAAEEVARCCYPSVSFLL